ncbi:MAG: DUF2268 domain-containing putative Zn-dependent protease [Thermodesulfobacteriota bacterium]
MARRKIWVWAIMGIMIAVALGINPFFGGRDGAPVESCSWAAAPIGAGVGTIKTTTFEDGHKLFDLVPAFIEYAEKGLKADGTSRRAWWEAKVESVHPEFFNQVIYRSFKGQARERFKQEIINQFWNQTVEKMDEVRTLDQDIARKVLESRKVFKKNFPDFNPDCDYYVTISFSFHGKAVELNGRTILALGLENFSPGGPELDMILAHEQFHLHHFRAFSVSGGLYRGVWAEGLATVASEKLVPGHRFSQYLGFTGRRMNEIHERYQDLVKDLGKNIDSTDPAVKRAYLGMEDNQLGVPPGAGYYLGENIVQVLMKQGHGLGEMARWEAEKVRRKMWEVLPALKRD